MKTMEFAVKELEQYTAKLGVCPKILLSVDLERFDTARFPHFDAALDDAFSIDVKDGCGRICGTNERAVLLGVYHFLKAQGCRFPRPGAEYVPTIPAVVDCCETIYAHSRHRGVSCGGCNGGFEAMFALICWLPKVMLNTYFIEMTDPFWNMAFAYRAGKNPYKETKELTREAFDRYMQALTEAMRERGILRHGAGHGWTMMLMEGVGELKNKPQLAALGETPVCTNPEVLPMIGGKRTLWENTPLNTHVCLSNKAVRAAFVKNVCAYSEAHPEMDYLHIWLGDSFANFCECDDCAAMTPTDWYVLLLNEIDAELTRRGSQQKLVFLAYFELLYPPVTQRLKNEKRFTMLFCPFGRDFTVAYRDVKPAAYTPARNNTFSWEDMRGEYYLQQLKEWQELFHGDSIVFDYTMFERTSFLDMTNLRTTPLLTDDTIHIKEYGLGGRIECGNPRAMVPSPINYLSLAHGLFYGEPLDEKAMYADIFGDGEPFSAFLPRIKEALPLDIPCRKRTYLTSREAATLKAAATEIAEFLKTASAYTPSTAFQKENCRLAVEWLKITEVVYSALAAQNAEQSEEIRRLVFGLEQTAPFAVPAASFFAHISDVLETQTETIV